MMPSFRTKHDGGAVRSRRHIRDIPRVPAFSGTVPRCRSGQYFGRMAKMECCRYIRQSGCNQDFSLVRRLTYGSRQIGLSATVVQRSFEQGCPCSRDCCARPQSASIGSTPSREAGLSAMRATVTENSVDIDEVRGAVSCQDALPRSFAGSRCETLVPDIC